MNISARGCKVDSMARAFTSRVGYSRIANALAFLSTFIRARWGFRFKSRAQLEAWQQRKLQRFRKQTLHRLGFYRDYSQAGFEDIPVVSKALMLEKFNQFNLYGIELESALQTALEAERNRDFNKTLGKGITVGLSSGTSGKRGVFIVSQYERSLWAGLILARALSSQSLRRLLNPFRPALRIAFFLRANSKLYTTVHSWRIKFHFFDLLDSFEDHLQKLDALQPHILIAPSSVLNALAEAQLQAKYSIHPDQVISVAEVLEQDDSDRVRQAWNVATQQIYQCTEGFLGYSCEQGHIHLNEEFIYFEKDWVDTRQSRFQPIITDFTRHSQVFARYCLDDILRIDPAPCECGRYSLRIASIEGRHDDVLWMQAANKPTLQAVFPDLVRRSMSLAQPGFSEYRLVQLGSELSVYLKLTDEDKDKVKARVVEELNLLCERHRVIPLSLNFEPWPEIKLHNKRRRIQCKQKPQLVKPDNAALA